MPLVERSHFGCGFKTLALQRFRPLSEYWMRSRADLPMPELTP